MNETDLDDENLVCDRCQTILEVDWVVCPYCGGEDGGSE